MAAAVILLLPLVNCGGGAGGGQNCVGAACNPQQAATHFSVTASSGNASEGVAFNFTVQALDAAGAVVATYTGTVHFTSSDTHAVLPKDTTLTNGTGNFPVTFQSLGNQTITATDTIQGSMSGTSSVIAVGPGPATHFLVSAPAAATTGLAFQMTVTAQDALNNTVTAYSGTVHFTSSDAQATLPANSTLTNGTGTFSVTLKTLGSQTITATDTGTPSINGTSGSITVGTNAATHFSVTGPPATSPGSTISFAVKALDAANNVASTYSGTIHFTTSDAQASLPANSTLTNGTGKFSVTFQTLGNQTITATDTINASITGTSNAINVGGFVITSGPPPNGTVGVGYGSPSCATQPLGFMLTTNKGIGKFTRFSGSSLPPGLKIGEFTCPGGPPPPPPVPYPVWLLYGVPTQAGTFSNVVITVTDIFGTASATYTITINPAAANPAAADTPDPHILTFDAPGAGTGPGQGTTPEQINQFGWIAGFFVDASGVSHGFVRDAHGKITTIDAPGAGTSPGTGTVAYGINDAGTVVGGYRDNLGADHSYLRTHDGTITTFDDPASGGACGTGCHQGTHAAAINLAGTISGFYIDASDGGHGFLRTPDGTFIDFDPSNSGFTVADTLGIDPAGAITGPYFDLNGMEHGFLRAPDGVITTFDAPGGGTGFEQGTIPSAISPNGTIPGIVIDDSGVSHGFLRAPDGAIITFNIPHAGTAAGQGTYPSATNLAGITPGFYVDTSGVDHAFVRAPGGQYHFFDVPVAGKSPGQGTVPASINNSGAVTGYFVDASGAIHGFVWFP
jgi:hypothetical protein